MPGPRVFTINSPEMRAAAATFVADATKAPDGWRVLLLPPPMSNAQRGRFRMVCRAIVNYGIRFQGRRRTEDEWAVLLVSAHATACGRDSEVVTGLEGELIDIREETARMDQRRGASLIEFATAWAISSGVSIPDSQPRRV